MENQMPLDKVRFSLAEHVWQGFHRKGDVGMVGSLVFVTADTLRQLTDFLYDLYGKDDLNYPQGYEQLALGSDGMLTSPDGLTPLYPFVDAEPTIVQRFKVTNERWTGNGKWVNEETLDSFDGPGDGDWTPVLHGFVMGRDDPKIELEKDREPKVAFVTIEYTDGTKARMEFCADETPLNGSGTSYTGEVPDANTDLECQISDAVTGLNLWPTKSYVL
jgi:hypothetical protein